MCGPLLRANEHGPCSILTLTTLHGTRRVGRLPVKWLEGTEEDLRNIGVGIW
jgi:hypothetical protein